MNSGNERPLILIVHGPNLNLLGEREPEVYGTMTLDDLNREILLYAYSKEVDALFFQSNHEGEIIDFLHDKRNTANGLVINPGAFTHYSIAIRDAIAGINIPAVEVHLSDIHKRESFRKTSVIKDICIDQISGLGKESYLRGLDVLLANMEKNA
ncbi:type II 3-dehydroquinate dehydratase [candidate division KSB1 bacterium]|nr:type II 3-dehydroquinate dehydratase [candidate division KSB1 bacterium]